MSLLIPSVTVAVTASMGAPGGANAINSPSQPFEGLKSELLYTWKTMCIYSSKCISRYVLTICTHSVPHPSQWQPKLWREEKIATAWPYSRDHLKFMLD